MEISDAEYERLKRIEDAALSLGLAMEKDDISSRRLSILNEALKPVYEPLVGDEDAWAVYDADATWKGRKSQLGALYLRKAADRAVENFKRGIPPNTQALQMEKWLREWADQEEAL